MKASASFRPEYLAAALWFAAHLPSLAPSLEDTDSINFALGLRHFDPALHQPHPPGYPVYIALGRLSLAVVSRVTSLERIPAEALALAIWSAIGGAIAIVAAAAFFRALRAGPGRTVAWAMLFTAAAPLFWTSGLRPMSDMTGLAAVFVSLALTANGMHDRRWLTAGAFVAALAVGIRVQTIWLTVPLLLVTMVVQRRAGLWWLISRPAAAFVAGGLLWGIPLLIASGGLDAYLRALNTQAELDFAGVDMLWLDPTPRRLAFSLYETFAMPWSMLPLAAAVLIAATAGTLVMLLRERAALGLLLVVFAPYAIFHLLLQETITVRYALPLVPLVAWLAARGIAAAGARAGSLASVVLLAALIVTAVPGGIVYGREAHPAFRAIADAERQARRRPPAAMYAHYSLLRPLQAIEAPPFRIEAPRLHREWLGLVDYWRGGGSDAVWFLADPRRTDLALIDPLARQDVTHYLWPAGERAELSGVRPNRVDWYRIAPPGWFAGEGWSLTPETGGEARANAKGPDQQPIHAWVRRRAEPMHLLIGTRHLGDPGDPPAEFELAIDGQVRDSWTLPLEQQNSLRFLDLPGGLPGEGRYAEVTVSTRSPGGRRVPAAVRQFDIQPASRSIAGFGEGWYELEYEPSTGTIWRWSSDHAVLRVHGPPQTMRLTLVAESPLRYFDTPPLVRVMAGERTIDEFRPDAGFSRTITIPRDAMAAAGGAVTIVQDRAYLPGAAEGTADARRLGLRLFSVQIDPVLP